MCDDKEKDLPDLVQPPELGSEWLPAWPPLFRQSSRNQANGNAGLCARHLWAGEDPLDELKAWQNSGSRRGRCEGSALLVGHGLTMGTVCL